MKKVISIISFIIAAGFILYTYSYAKWPFDYHVANILTWILLWSAIFFVSSIFAFVFEKKIYKIWLSVSSVYIVIAILIANLIGDGNGSIVSINGEIATWFFAGIYIVCFIVLFIRSRKKYFKLS
jgi:hypothetical protein